MRPEENSTRTSLYAPWTASIISPLSLARETGFPSGVRVLSLSTPSPTVIQLSCVTWAAFQARLGENREIEIERQNLGGFLCHLYPESSQIKTAKFSCETAFLVLLSHLVFPFFRLHQVLVILPMGFFVLNADPKVWHKIHTGGLPWWSSG